MDNSLNFDRNLMKHFDTLKSQQSVIQDASRKSSIDFRIRQLVEAINTSENFFTTSSCSGRFIAFSQDEVFIKKNCEWIKVSHDPLDEKEIEAFIELIESEKEKHNQIVLKFEPFILHVCCRTLGHAKLMLDQCIASGYRNSGISIGSSKIILAVRSTHNLECPISQSGKLLVNSDYIRFICQMSNEKFRENFERIEKYFKNIQSTCLALTKENTVESKSNANRTLKAKKRSEKKSLFLNAKAEKRESNSTAVDTKTEISFDENELNIYFMNNL